MNDMNEANVHRLTDILEVRRLTAGNGVKALGWQSWGQMLGIQFSTLFRFNRGEIGLGLGTLRRLAAWATQNNDNELLEALTGYALDLR